MTVGTRHPASGAALPEIRLRLEQMPGEEHWADIAQQFDVVLNCVGILRQRTGETYEDIHNVAPAAIASACQKHNTRFVHVSALGLTADSRSRFLTSKYRGEQAIAAIGGDWAVVRLSLLDGEGGFGAAWLRGVSKLPFFVVPTSAKGKIAALTADDAGEALSNLSLKSRDELDFETSRYFELGGERAFHFKDYILGLRSRYTSKPALCIPIPGIFARIGAHLCDVVHFSPFSFGHWELLGRDNVPSPNRLAELLGRPPAEVIDE